MYVITCCTSVDLEESYLVENGVRYIPFHFELDGVPHVDDLGRTLPYSELYEAIRNGAVSHTSQINIMEYYSFFKSIFEEGYDVLHITLSGGLSGSVNSAQNAAAMLADEFPERVLKIVDSVNASSGHGILVEWAVEHKNAGMSIEENATLLESERMNIQAWFFTTTLKYLIRGGRVSKAAGLIGETLGICPLLMIDAEGKLIPMEKVRTKKKVALALLDRMLSVTENGADYSGPCHVCHSDCKEDADTMIALIESRFPNLIGKIKLHEVGTIIGSHTGPGTIGVFFRGVRKD